MSGSKARERIAGGKKKGKKNDMPDNIDRRSAWEWRNRARERDASTFQYIPRLNMGQGHWGEGVSDARGQRPEVRG